MGKFSINYELIRFNNASDNEFHEASEIYRRTTPRDQKTNVREINYWVDHCKKFAMGELFFFGLKANNLVIGYAELAYIKQERLLIIDYINLDPDYKSNSNFYSFYMLIVNYMDNHGIDYDYITKEIFRKSKEEEIRREDVRQYELENFKVINSLYIQPQLETINVESMRDALIMLYTRASNKSELKKAEYLHIVQVLYDYYLCWDKKVCNSKEFYDRSKKAESNIKKIAESIVDDEVILNGYPLDCSSNMYVTKIPKKRQNAFLVSVGCIIGFVTLLLVILYVSYLINFGIHAIIALGSLLILVFLLIYIIRDPDSLKHLKSIPIIRSLLSLE